MSLLSAGVEYGVGVGVGLCLISSFNVGVSVGIGVGVEIFIGEGVGVGVTVTDKTSDWLTGWVVVDVPATSELLVDVTAIGVIKIKPNIRTNFFFTDNELNFSII